MLHPVNPFHTIGLFRKAVGLSRFKGYRKRAVAWNRLIKAIVHLSQAQRHQKIPTVRVIVKKKKKKKKIIYINVEENMDKGRFVKDILK